MNINKIKLFIFGSLSIIIWSYYIYTQNQIKIIKFSGVVTSVYYNNDNHPCVKIKNKKYLLTIDDFDIKVGDYLTKKDGSSRVTQFRKKEKINSLEWQK